MTKWNNKHEKDQINLNLKKHQYINIRTYMCKTTAFKHWILTIHNMFLCALIAHSGLSGTLGDKVG